MISITCNETVGENACASVTSTINGVSFNLKECTNGTSGCNQLCSTPPDESKCTVI